MLEERMWGLSPYPSKLRKQQVRATTMIKQYDPSKIAAAFARPRSSWDGTVGRRRWGWVHLRPDHFYLAFLVRAFSDTKWSKSTERARATGQCTKHERPLQYRFYRLVNTCVFPSSWTAELAHPLKEGLCGVHRNRHWLSVTGNLKDHHWLLLKNMIIIITKKKNTSMIVNWVWSS